MPKLDVDENGVITTPGRFTGMTMTEVVDYTTALEQSYEHATKNGGKATVPPASTVAAPKKTPQEILAENAARRTQPLSDAATQRMVDDDEAAFAATVDDYEELRAKIHEIRASLDPSLLLKRGVHEWIYGNVKLQNPEIRRKIYGKAAAAPPAEEEGEEGEGGEAAAEEVPPVTPPPAPPKVVAKGPKPAPPRVAKPAVPTPPPARAQAPTKKSKLVATDKVKAFAKSAGIDVDTYLAGLEEQGFTQAQIDALSTRGSRGGSRVSVYDIGE